MSYPYQRRFSERDPTERAIRKAMRGSSMTEKEARYRAAIREAARYDRLEEFFEANPRWIKVERGRSFGENYAELYTRKNHCRWERERAFHAARFEEIMNRTARSESSILGGIGNPFEA